MFYRTTKIQAIWVYPAKIDYLDKLPATQDPDLLFIHLPSRFWNHYSLSSHFFVLVDLWLLQLFLKYNLSRKFHKP